MATKRAKAKKAEEEQLDENGNPIPAHTPAPDSGMPMPNVPAAGEPGTFGGGGTGNATTTHGQGDPRTAPPTSR